MKTILCLLIFSGILYLPLAQAQQPKIPPLPRGPLLNNAPSFSEWLVSVTSDPVDPDKGVVPKKFDSRTLVRKTGDIRNEIKVTVDNPKAESWFKDGWQAKLVGNGKPPLVFLPGANTLAGVYTDYGKGDFFGFGWISKRNYAGIQKISGADCIIFHAEPPPDPTAAISPAPNSGSAASSPATPAFTGTTAYIALDSRLPVMLKEPDKTTLYEFKQPPTAMLTLPPDVAAAFAGVQSTISHLSAAPAAP
jgi:hypothetical protein